MIRGLTPNRAVAFVVFAPIFYFILSLFLDVPTLRNLFNSLSLGVAVVLTGTYFFSFIDAIRHNVSTRPWKMIAAITVIWMTVLANRIYSAMYNYYGRPQSWADSVISGYWPYSYFIAGALFLMASTDDKEGFVPSLVPLMIAVAIGSGFMGLLVGLGISSF